MTDDELMQLMQLARDCGIVCDQLWGDEYIATCSVAAIGRFAAEIERRTLERAAAACDERAKAARVFCKARNLPDYIAVEAEGLGRTIRALVTK